VSRRTAAPHQPLPAPARALLRSPALPRTPALPAPIGGGGRGPHG
jgi:hypothetical protein